jgi:hypothetical protein
MGGMFIRLLIGVLLAGLLEFVNGVFTFMLPPLIVITPACLAIALAWAVSYSRSRKDEWRDSGSTWKRSWGASDMQVLR